jgi:tetratricopeptide (TPR) repeat protein
MKTIASISTLLFMIGLTVSQAADTPALASVAAAQDILNKANDATNAYDWAAAVKFWALPYLANDKVIQTESDAVAVLQDYNKTIVSSTSRILNVLDKKLITPYLPDVAKPYAASADLIALVEETDTPKSGDPVDYTYAQMFRIVDGRLHGFASVNDPIGGIVDSGDKKRIAGDNKGAIAIYDTAISLAPNDAEPYNMRGFSHEDLSDYASASADFSKAVEFAPTDSIYRYNLAAALMKLNQDGPALDQINESIRLDPKNIDAFMDRGRLRDKQGDYKDAIADYEKAVSIPPPYPTSYNVEGWQVSEQAVIDTLLGDAKMKVKDFAGAAGAYGAAIDESTKFPLAYEGRAKARAAMSDTAGADQDNATAKQIRADPNKFPTVTGKEILKSFLNWFQ